MGNALRTLRVLVDEHKLVRRLVLAWWLAIATTSLGWAMTRDVLTAEQAGIVEAVLEMATVVFSLYTAGRVAQDVWTRPRRRRSPPAGPIGDL